jgi:MOSC domain-containing protein YiiM
LEAEVRLSSNSQPRSRLKIRKSRRSDITAIIPAVWNARRRRSQAQADFWNPTGYDLTLIAAEVLDELAAAGHTLDFVGARRNILTRGIDVNALVGRTFRIGDVICRGSRLCEPCVHLDRLSGSGLLRPLIHRGGLRADILTNGEIRLGAPIRLA